MCQLYVFKRPGTGRHLAEGALVEGALVEGVAGGLILTPPFCLSSTSRAGLVEGGREDGGWVKRSPPFSPMAS